MMMHLLGRFVLPTHRELLNLPIVLDCPSEQFGLLGSDDTVEHTSILATSPLVAGAVTRRGVDRTAAVLASADLHPMSGSPRYAVSAGDTAPDHRVRIAISGLPIMPAK
jgi:hypothetical protein